MKRSEINAYMKEAEAFFNSYSVKLPKWAYWGCADWQGKGVEFDQIRRCAMGWDITDFGSGDFEKQGLLLFTTRNGCINDEKPKPYAEKIMISREAQITPTHFHWHKMEDIINRGGGVLAMQLWMADEREEFSDKRFTVYIDGVSTEIEPGQIVRLEPGESITLEPYVYHKFWAEGAMTLVWEVSMVNDDENDNRFYLPAGRFPEIEEDEAPLHLLCNEYPCPSHD